MAAITAEEMTLARPYFLNGYRELRACKRCRFIMEMDQFVTAGCPTCKDVLVMKDDPARVRDCTTANYVGCIAMMRPGSFVTRYNGLEKRMPGFYALRVYDKIPDHIRHERTMEDEEDLADFIAPPTPTDGRGVKRPAEDRDLADDVFSPEADAKLAVDDDEFDELAKDAGIFSDAEDKAEDEAKAEGEAKEKAASEAPNLDAEAAEAKSFEAFAADADAESEREEEPSEQKQEKKVTESGSESEEDLPDRPYPSGSEKDSGASGTESKGSRKSGEESAASAGAQTSASSKSSRMILEKEDDAEFRRTIGR